MIINYELVGALIARGRLGVVLKFHPVFADLREQPDYEQLLTDYKA